MFFEYSFPFGISHLQIKSAEKISQKALKELSVLIEVFQFELNYNLINSSAYTLNNTQLNLSAYVKEEFVDFLKYNLKIYEKFKAIINPFKSKESLNPLESYSIFFKDNIIVRREDVFFNTSLLNKIYVIEKVNQYLKEERVKSYLLISENIQSSFGFYRWNTHFFIPELNESIKFKLYNQNALLELVEINKSDKIAKFANLDKSINAKQIIIIGDDLVKLKVVTSQLNTATHKYDFEKLASKQGVNLIVIDSNSEVNIF